MPYKILYQRDARADWDAACGDYGSKLREDTTEWFATLAEHAETRDNSLSFELANLVEAAASGTKGSWAHSFNRWLQANASEKFWGFIALLRKRRPPWELRVASRTFFVVSAFDCTVTAYFEINHVEKTIVFRHFEGFPHQG